MPVEKFKEVASCICLGVGFLAIVAILDCWRPGSSLINFDGTKVRLRRECCGVICKRGLIIPIILVICLALLILDCAYQDDVCLTPFGYCSTISCVCGNIIWQGYVFMFVCLTLTPVLLLVGVLRKARRYFLCWTCATCAQYRNRPGHRDVISAHDFFILWPYLIGAALVSLTGMMPYLISGGAISEYLSKVTDVAHNYGVLTAVCAPLLSAIFLSVQRFYEATGNWSHKQFCCCTFNSKSQNNKDVVPSVLQSEILILKNVDEPLHATSLLINNEGTLPKKAPNNARNDHISKNKTYSSVGHQSERPFVTDINHVSTTSQHKTYYAALKGCNHHAWASVGYLLMVVAGVICVAAMFVMLARTSDSGPTSKYDLCINNDDEITCSKGNGCKWSNLTSPSCSNPDCSQENIVASAVEYLVLMLAFANLCIMLPAIVNAVDGGDASVVDERLFLQDHDSESRAT